MSPHRHRLPLLVLLCFVAGVSCTSNSINDNDATSGIRRRLPKDDDLKTIAEEIIKDGNFLIKDGIAVACAWATKVKSKIEHRCDSEAYGVNFNGVPVKYLCPDECDISKNAAINGIIKAIRGSYGSSDDGEYIPTLSSPSGPSNSASAAIANRLDEGRFINDDGIEVGCRWLLKVKGKTKFRCDRNSFDGIPIKFLCPTECGISRNAALAGLENAMGSTSDDAPLPALPATSYYNTAKLATPSDFTASYEPGNLQDFKHGIYLSKGLDCRIVATSGESVKFSNGQQSSEKFHMAPDFGAAFSTPDGGWVYVSNSEVENKKGGVGAIYFNERGNIVDYKMLLEKTSMNCGGGKTPWGTWISCEEVRKEGEIWEVDPQGIRKPKKTVLGRTVEPNGDVNGGRFESFTYDIRKKNDPRFYYTEDRPDGALRRFRPANPNWDDPYNMLHQNGHIDYLLLTATSNNRGKFEWTKDITKARKCAEKFFPGSEGIDAHDGSLYFVSKKDLVMYILDLDNGTWRRQSTKGGAFDGSPDQLARIVGKQEILYFTEEGGDDAGVHARDSDGNFYSILESPVYREETTGLAFSPDHTRMYVAYQKNGIVVEVTRKDGLPFSEKTLNIKYHNTALNRNK